MFSQSTHRTESASARFTPDECFQAIEKNRERLHAVEYACFGLAHLRSHNADCLVWIVADVLADLERLGATLETCSFKQRKSEKRK